MSIRKIFGRTILFFAFIFMAFFGAVFGQESQSQFAANYCDSVGFTVQGPNVSLKDATQEYTIGVTFSDSGVLQPAVQDLMVVPNEILEETSLRWELVLDGTVLARSTDDVFSYNFDAYGTYVLRVFLDYQGCDRVIEHSVGVYDEIYTYVGPFIQDFNYGILTNIRQNNKLLHTYIPQAQNTVQSESFVANIVRQRAAIRQSSGVFFSTNQYALIFDAIRDLQTLGVDFRNIPIFLIDDGNKTIITKFLVRFMKEYDIQTVYIISNEEFVSMLLSLSVGKNPYDFAALENSVVRISGVRSYLSLGGVIDYLLFYGFPLDTLVILLGIVIAILFVVFCKQVVGLSSFGVYYPIIFGLALHTIGVKTSFSLLLLAILAKITIVFLIRKYTILATAKLGFQLFVYIVYIILGLVLYSVVFGSRGVEYTIFTNPMILVAIVAILLVGTKVWTLSSLKVTKSQLGNLLWFVVLSVASYFIINSPRLHTFILLYPMVLVVAAFVIILLGRYTGLQFVEYLRFWPLIRYIRKK